MASGPTSQHPKLAASGARGDVLPTRCSASALHPRDGPRAAAIGASRLARQAPMQKLFAGVTRTWSAPMATCSAAPSATRWIASTSRWEARSTPICSGSSTGLGNAYQLVIEDLTLSLPDQGGAQRPDQVKADMVLFPVDADGWVFSVGSITYAGALAWNSCDNEPVASHRQRAARLREPQARAGLTALHPKGDPRSSGLF